MYILLLYEIKLFFLRYFLCYKIKVIKYFKYNNNLLFQNYYCYYFILKNVLKSATYKKLSMD